MTTQSIWKIRLKGQCLRAKYRLSWWWQDSALRRCLWNWFEPDHRRPVSVQLEFPGLQSRRKDP